MVMKNYIEESVKFRMGKWYDQKFKRNEFHWDELDNKNYHYGFNDRWIHFTDQFKDAGYDLNPGVVLTGADHLEYDKFSKIYGRQIPVGAHNRNSHSKDSIIFTLKSSLRHVFRIHQQSKDRHKYDFDEKKDEIIWRGRFTGRANGCKDLYEVDDIENDINKFLRFRFVEKWSKKYNIKFTKEYDWQDESHWLDMKTKTEQQRTPRECRSLYNKEYVENYFKENNHMVDDYIAFFHWRARNPPKTIDEYKYILSLDGHDWASCLSFVLMTNSVMIGPIPKWHNIFNLQLAPWEHYVPVLDDASDLDKKLTWCKNHQNECKEIIQRANQYISQFTEDSEAEITKNIIQRLYKNSIKC